MASLNLCFIQSNGFISPISRIYIVQVIMITFSLHNELSHHVLVTIQSLYWTFTPFHQSNMKLLGWNKINFNQLIKGSNMILCVLLVSNSWGCCLAAPGDHEGADAII